MLEATITTMAFTIAMFILVGASVGYAIKTYINNKETAKFNMAYQFFQDFKNSYIKDFNEIIRVDKNTIRVNKSELWFKARNICKFFSFLGQSLKMGKIDIKNIYPFFYEYLFDQEKLIFFLKQVKSIYSGRKWENSEQLLVVTRDSFNYLINEIGKIDEECQEYKDLIEKYINVIGKKTSYGTLSLNGSLSNGMSICQKIFAKLKKR